MWVEFFEAFMLVCFGSAWPFAIAKSWRSRSAAGKSPLFLMIIFTGYLSGICAHLCREFSPVVFLYGTNAVMVATDLFLVLHFRRCPGKRPFSSIAPWTFPWVPPESNDTCRPNSCNTLL